jgi:hypothetical protein
LFSPLYRLLLPKFCNLCVGSINGLYDKEGSSDYEAGMRYAGGGEEMAARAYTGFAFSFIGPSKAAGSRFLAWLVVATLAPATAFAYLDPNTPGILYQIFFPLVIAVTLAWRRIKDTVSWLWLRIWRKED